MRAETILGQPVLSRERWWAEVELTPERAQALLGTNFWPSAPVERRVAGIAEMILQGRPGPGRDGLSFDASGRLRDGRHTCLAVIRAGIPVRTVAVFNDADGLRHNPG